MKYVEAMIDTAHAFDAPGSFPWGKIEAMVNALSVVEEAHPSDIRVGALSEAIDAVIGEAKDHDSCYGASALVPLSSSETIAAQMERTGFLNAEPVAIVRLADLHALMERANEAR